MKQKEWERKVLGRMGAEICTPLEGMREVTTRQSLISHGNEFGQYHKGQYRGLSKRVTHLIRTAF